jgi:hypothetical protein
MADANLIRPEGTAADWTIPQNWRAYSAQEHATWDALFERQVGMLPGRVRYSHLFGGAVLAGIGFTIALFITDLAFSDPALRDQAKIGILAGSLTAALLGAWILRIMGERTSLCSPAGAGAPAVLPPLPWSPPSRRFGVQ